MAADRSGPGVLSREECLGLLATTSRGRAAFQAGAIPVILPVTYVVDNGGVVFREPAGSRLPGVAPDAVVAFEADGVDVAGSEWTVAVTGVAAEVDDRAARARLARLAPDESGGDDVARLVRISPDLVSGLRRTVSAGAPGRAAAAETHAGVVFLVGDRAYKLKKPVQFGFVDFRTREARMAACRREVELNRRLAPDVYLGVADVSGPDGAPCDHLVVMRRMPEDRRLSFLVTTGAPLGPHLERLADLLARFHREAPSSPAVDRAAGRDAVMKRWEDNAEEMAPFRHLLDPAVVDDVTVLARRYVAGRGPLFEQRIEAGRVRDGHGDLLADDIFCLDDGPRVLDCLEFDDALRYGDVLADVAFLAMDLERLGRPDLAASFLDHYRTAAADGWPASLAEHYIAYRAQVRAKVACLRSAQGDASSADVAARLLRLCRAHLRRAQVRLVLVGGAPGTGKSTVAAGLAEPLGAEVIRSDVVRRELAGLRMGGPVPAGIDEGIYRPVMTDATYSELLGRARRALELGHGVVLDATWQQRRWRRAAARVAEECSAELVELRCVAPLDVAVDRVERRLAAGTDVSGATEEVARARADAGRDWTSATVVDTSGAPGAAVAFALARVTGQESAEGR